MTTTIPSLPQPNQAVIEQRILFAESLANLDSVGASLSGNYLEAACQCKPLSMSSAQLVGVSLHHNSRRSCHPPASVATLASMPNRCAFILRSQNASFFATMTTAKSIEIGLSPQLVPLQRCIVVMSPAASFMHPRPP